MSKTPSGSVISKARLAHRLSMRTTNPGERQAAQAALDRLFKKYPSLRAKVLGAPQPDWRRRWAWLAKDRKSRKRQVARAMGFM